MCLFLHWYYITKMFSSYKSMLCKIDYLDCVICNGELLLVETDNYACMILSDLQFAQLR